MTEEFYNDETGMHRFCTKCEDGYFFNGQNCVPCSHDLGDNCAECEASPFSTNQYIVPTCTKCTGGTKVSRTRLENGQITNGCANRRSLTACLVSDDPNVSDNCVVCEDGHYLNDGSCQKCSNAVEGCSQCTDTGKCLDCVDGFQLENGKCKQVECLSNQYSEMGECKNCHDVYPHCGQCKIVAGDLRCTSCHNNLEFQVQGDDNSCGCNRFQTVVDSSSDARCEYCSSIHQGCVSCNADQCLECKSGLYLTKEGQCVSEVCQARDSTGDCTQCNSKAGVAFYPEGQDCVKQCSTGMELVDGQCRPEVKCEDKNCAKCTRDNVCVQCKPNLPCSIECPKHALFDMKSGKCTYSCPPNALVMTKELEGYPSPRCDHCSSDCTRCELNSLGLKECLECSDGLLAFNHGCKEKCPQGYRPMEGLCLPK